MNPYPDVAARPELVAVERDMIVRWNREQTFLASIANREHGSEFVLYDGPPFANGVPHYGHLLTGFVKDVIPRYRTMRGDRVERRFGWDCHGLPVEMQAENELAIHGYNAISSFGVERFNEHCRGIVGATATAWEEYVERQARWVDMENDYKTLDIDFMESVMWAFKQLHERGLLYEGLRVLPYCWECETPLSNFETRLDGSYRHRDDIAVTVAFELDAGELLLAWTTTPWTLPCNLALGVGSKMNYAIVERGGRRYILSEESLPSYKHELGDGDRVGSLRGSELVGRRYKPLFSYFDGIPDAFVVLDADFVKAGEGTGIVHLAPGFGEDDQRVCEAAGIAPVAPVDRHARFTAEVAEYAGMQVFDAVPAIVADLGARGRIVRSARHPHSYPHCWRSDTPLIYKAMPSWFLAVTAIKDRMIELNQSIQWVPGHVKDGSFGQWLEGARDWSISRNRFWGSPLPVWKSDDPRYPRVDVYGSLDELEHDFGVRPTDLHRPAIDQLERPNPDDPTGRSTMRRVPEVLDCWFESGSMPFAQVHYPFEHREWFDCHFPGDFIVEYIGQTRGWFYTLHVIATALFDRPAFKACLAHGVLLGDDGQKLSKRLRNYPDPSDVFDTVGSDAMRWSLMSSSAVRGGDMIAERSAMEEAPREVMLPLWSAWHFLTLHANAAGIKGQLITTPEHDLDRYAVAATSDVCDAVAAHLDRYDISGACAAVAGHVDALNNWYIRRSRDRFRAGDQGAIDTLHTALSLLCRIAAPLLPLLTDAIFRQLGDGASVHLADWPEAHELQHDRELIVAMNAARDVCTAGASVRTANGRRRRLPLARAKVAVEDSKRLEGLVSLIRAEINVKGVDFVTFGELGRERIQLDLATVAPRLRDKTPSVRRALQAGEYEYDEKADRLSVLGFMFESGEFTRRLVPLHPASTAVINGGKGLVALDLMVTDDLTAEGLAQDLVRVLNDQRRKHNLDLADRVRFALHVPDGGDIAAVVEAHGDVIRGETGASAITVRPLTSDCASVELPDGRCIRVSLLVTEARS